MNKLNRVIDSFYFVSLVLQMLGFIISISLIKTLNVDLILLLLPIIIMTIISIVSVCIYFFNRINNLSLIKMHISEKTYWFDFYPIVIYIINVIFNSICIFVFIKTQLSWLLIFSIVFSFLLFGIGLSLFFKSNMNINKELNDRRNRGIND